MAVAYSGALVAVVAVFAYSALVMVYVVSRSSASIYSIMPIGERTAILFASGISVAYSVAVFSVLMAVPFSIVGFASSIILKKALLYFNPFCIPKRAVFISATMALAMLILVYVLLKISLKNWMTMDYLEMLLFWFGFPAVFFSVSCIVGGMKLNEIQ